MNINNFFINILGFFLFFNLNFLIAQHNPCLICNVKTTTAFLTPNTYKLNFLIKHKIDDHISYINNLYQKNRAEKLKGFSELLKVLKWIKFKPEKEVGNFKKKLVSLILNSDISDSEKTLLLFKNNFGKVLANMIISEDQSSIIFFKKNFLDLCNYFGIESFSQIEEFILAQPDIEYYLEYLVNYYFDKAQNDNFFKHFAADETVNKAYEYANAGIYKYKNKICQRAKSYFDLVGITNHINKDKDIVSWKVKPKSKDFKKIFDFAEKENDDYAKAMLAIWFLESKEFAKAKHYAETISTDSKYAFYGNLVLVLMKLTGVIFQDKLIENPNNAFPDLVSGFKNWLYALEHSSKLSNIVLGDNAIFLKASVVLAYQLELATLDKIVTISKGVGEAFFKRFQEELSKKELALIKYNDHYLVTKESDLSQF